MTPAISGPEHPVAPEYRRSRRSLTGAANRGWLGGAVGAVSTVAVLGTLVVVVVSSPGWPKFKAFFLSGEAFRRALPDVASGFLLNIKIFLIAEVLILIVALFVAVLRGAQGPLFFPFRLLGTLYVDVFRGVPTLLVIYILGLGFPQLRINGLPKDPVFWGVTALVLSYSAYVAEVYRAGIESIHPSQRSAARSLGLNESQTMRFVVLPQAVRRVVPPLLNDFVSLQKDTALVSVLGPLEAMRQAQIDAAANFNFTAYFVAAGLFLLATIPLARFTDWLLARSAGARR